MNRLIFLLILLLTISCKKDDPCDGISCVNGDCVEGTCACETGWKGALCDEIDFDFVGSYTAKSIIYSECDDAQYNGVILANSFDEFCLPENAEGAITCFEYHLKIKSNGTFEQFWVDKTKRGGFVVSERDPSEGTYEIDNGVITLCGSNWLTCEDMEVDNSRIGLDWKITPRSSKTGCFRKYVLIKDK